MLKPGSQSQPRIFIVNIIRKKIKRWLKDMNLMFSWYDKYLTGLLRSLVWYCFCHSNKKIHVLSPSCNTPKFSTSRAKESKRQTFYFIIIFFMEKGRNRTAQLIRNIANCQIENVFSTLIISMSFHGRIWRPVHTCEAKANANANRNANDSTHLKQTQENRDTQAQ